MDLIKKCLKKSIVVSIFVTSLCFASCDSETDCSVCDGSGVVVGSGIEYVCPACDGSGKQ